MNFLRTLKRLHFWIICPLVVVMGLAGWFMTIGKLQKEKKKNLSDIETKFSAMGSISGETVHPNENVQQGMDTMIGERRGEVAAAWQEKWDQQTQEGGVLTWPDFDWPERVKKEFIDQVKDLRPIEKTVAYPLPKEDDLRIGLRRLYRDYIQSELPSLAEMIGAVWVPSDSRRRGPQTERMTPNGMRLDEAMVAWNPENQQELQQEHFNWEPKFGMGPRLQGEGAPTKLEILYAQEDLWVLRAVMQIIQRANANSSARFNAAVKEIEWVRIGNQAIDSAGHITRITEQAAGQGMMGMGMEMGMGMRGEMPGGEMMGPPPGYEGGEMMGGEFQVAQVSPDPGEGRYISKDYSMLEAGKLRGVMQDTASVSPEDAYLVVAKRIPVRMRLKVDQRKLNKLLVECANSELTLEVREVRVNPSDDGSSQAGFGYQRSPREGEFQGRNPRGTSLGDDKTFSYDLTVEIYGIVYIYNPVDRSIIGYEDAESETPPEDEGDVAVRGIRPTPQTLVSGV